MKMNKYILFISAVFLIGCTAEPVHEEENTIPAPNNSIPQTIPEDEPEYDFSNGFSSADEAFAYMEGTWEILPKGSVRKAGSKVLTFTEDGLEMQLSDGYEGDYISSAYQIASDQIHIMPKEIIGVTNAYNPVILQEETDLQFYACIINGTDYLIFREIGKTGSYAKYALTNELRSEEGFWVFRRNVQNTREPQKYNKKTKESFYGICWKTDTYTYTIQEMEPAEEKEHVSLKYCANGHALAVTDYDLAGEEVRKKGEILTNPKGVYITTNEDGKIIDIEVLKYLSNGFYQPVKPYENPLHAELNPKAKDSIALSDAEETVTVIVETDKPVNTFQILSLKEKTEVFTQETFMPDQKLVFAVDKDIQYIFRFTDERGISHDYLLEINDQDKTITFTPYEG